MRHYFLKIDKTTITEQQFATVTIIEVQFYAYFLTTDKYGLSLERGIIEARFHYLR